MSSWRRPRLPSHSSQAWGLAAEPAVLRVGGHGEHLAGVGDGLVGQHPGIGQIVGDTDCHLIRLSPALIVTVCGDEMSSGLMTWLADTRCSRIHSCIEYAAKL